MFVPTQPKQKCRSGTKPGVITSPCKPPLSIPRDLLVLPPSAVNPTQANLCVEVRRLVEAMEIFKLYFRFLQDGNIYEAKLVSEQ